MTYFLKDASDRLSELYTLHQKKPWYFVARDIPLGNRTSRLVLFGLFDSPKEYPLQQNTKVSFGEVYTIQTACPKHLLRSKSSKEPERIKRRTQKTKGVNHPPIILQSSSNHHPIILQSSSNHPPIIPQSSSNIPSTSNIPASVKLGHQRSNIPSNHHPIIPQSSSNIPSTSNIPASVKLGHQSFQSNTTTTNEKQSPIYITNKQHTKQIHQTKIKHTC
jgi:hypothetical protein